MRKVTLVHRPDRENILPHTPSAEGSLSNDTQKGMFYLLTYHKMCIMCLHDKGRRWDDQAGISEVEFDDAAVLQSEASGLRVLRGAGDRGMRKVERARGLFEFRAGHGRITGGLHVGEGKQQEWVRTE